MIGDQLVATSFLIFLLRVGVRVRLALELCCSGLQIIAACEISEDFLPRFGDFRMGLRLEISHSDPQTVVPENVWARLRLVEGDKFTATSSEIFLSM